MELYQAVVLGIVQGLGEFLPISSSGHLILVPYLLGWPDQGQTFDVALHMGTLAGLLFFFWHDWIELTRAALTSLMTRSLANTQAKLAWFIFLGCLPAVGVGLVGEEWFGELRNPGLIAVLLIIFGLIMFAVDRWGQKLRDLPSMGWLDTLFIGVAQALALFPGVSRSGVTMTAGLMRGLNREAAARFSFLVATPITLGAGLLKFYGMTKSGGIPVDDRLPFLVGMATAAVVGFLAIKFMLNYVRKQSLQIFVWYRLAVGMIVLLVVFWRS
jgi:undecaprenyl-diphosphatase